jgi:uncharacterized protein (TIGR00251 family)
MTPHSPRRSQATKPAYGPEPAPREDARPAGSAGGALRVDALEGGIAFEVQVVPRSSRSEIAGVHGDRLRIKVNAPPVEGAANHAVRATIAKAFGVAQRQVTILRGLASRMKRIHVTGVDEAIARKILLG